MPSRAGTATLRSRRTSYFGVGKGKRGLAAAWDWRSAASKESAKAPRVRSLVMRRSCDGDGRGRVRPRLKSIGARGCAREAARLEGDRTLRHSSRRERTGVDQSLADRIDAQV